MQTIINPKNAPTKTIELSVALVAVVLPVAVAAAALREPLLTLTQLMQTIINPKNVLTKTIERSVALVAVVLLVAIAEAALREPLLTSIYQKKM